MRAGGKGGGQKMDIVMTIIALEKQGQKVRLVGEVGGQGRWARPVDKEGRQG